MISLRFLLLLALVSAAVAQTYSDPPYVFTTLAGAAAIGAADGPGNIARFNYPRGIAIDASGNLFVADGSNQTIRKITPAGVVSTLAGKADSTVNHALVVAADGTGSEARFSGPTGVGTDPGGNVYVTSNSKVVARKVTPDGTVTTLPGGYPLQSAPYITDRAVALDPAGNIYMTDEIGTGILKITPGGGTTTFAGGFAGVEGITVDSIGNLYVTDSGNYFAPDAGSSLIWKITPSGVSTALAGTPGILGKADGPAGSATFRGPIGITLDLAGNLSVADSGNASIRKITPAGFVNTLAGQSGVHGHVDGNSGTALFFEPYGVVADPAGNVYVSDYSDQTIRKVTPAGTVSTVAGLSPFQCYGSTDGNGTDARFSQPSAIAVGSAGELYVADTGNHTVRKITAGGVVSTLAGSAGSYGYADGDGPNARFSSPAAIAVDAGGNVYVVDQGNSIVRKITPAGKVSTLAGQTGGGASVDGPPGVATFGHIFGIAVLANGNLIISEESRLRTVAPDGTVATMPPSTLQPYSYFGALATDPAGNAYVLDADRGAVLKIDPAGTATRITANYLPAYGLARDAAGNFFVTGRKDHVVWKWAPDGTLSNVAGRLDVAGSTDGVGSDVRFENPSGIAADASGNIYVTCSAFNSNSIRKGQLAGSPVITTQPQTVTAARGSNAQFSVSATGVPSPVYQWYFNGTLFNGATGSTLNLSNIQPSDAGNYSVTATNSVGTVTSNPAALTVSAVTVTPPANPASGGSGGGATSGWFYVALAGLGAARWLARRQRGAVGWALCPITRTMTPGVKPGSRPTFDPGP